MDFVSIPLQSSQDFSPSNEEKDRGIVYISRIPPKMTPGILRELLTPYGAINRIFLVPKPSSKSQKFKKQRTNENNKIYRGTGFIEGWIEFTEKKKAKYAVEVLNCNSIGRPSKGKAFASDLWNLKYLSKFTWSHLTDQLAYEKAVREQKLRAEIAQAKKANQHYLVKSEKAREIEAIERKKKEKQSSNQVELDGEISHSVTDSVLSQISKKFRQRKPILRKDDD